MVMGLIGAGGGVRRRQGGVPSSVIVRQKGPLEWRSFGAWRCSWSPHAAEPPTPCRLRRYAVRAGNARGLVVVE
jgi:hypothetical protein